MSRWAPALRIAQRTVLASPARSLLVALLVALPVAGATFVDVLWRTTDSPEREAQRQLGSADASLIVTDVRTLQSVDPRGGYSEGKRPARRDPSAVAVTPLLPAGTRIVRAPRNQSVVLQRGERLVRAQLVVGDPRERLHRHAMRLEAGARPPGPGEALVSRRLAERLKLLDGDRLRAGAAVTLRDGPAVPIAGLVRDPFWLSSEQVVALPGSVLDRATAPRPTGGDRRDPAAPPDERQYLLELPAGTDHDALGRTLAAHGISLMSRDAVLHPERYISPAQQSGSGLDGRDLRTAALTAVIIGLGLLEVVLLAGTAFAVGARRQVRELGLVAASGGGARDVRRIVLAQGLVLGAIGALLGVAVGVAAAIGGQPLWERLMGQEIDAWVFSTLEIAGAALIGLLSGLAAAVIPAVGAARMSPIAALAGRFRTAASARRRSALIGAGLLVGGAICGLLGDHFLANDFAAYERALAEVERTGRYAQLSMPNRPLMLVIGGATLAVVGLVLLAPALIGALARAGSRLPLSARLAMRDAERHRHRTGPAAAAIVVAVSGSILLAFLLAGQNRGNELRSPPGVAAAHARRRTRRRLRGEHAARRRPRRRRAAGRAAPSAPGAAGPIPIRRGETC